MGKPQGDSWGRRPQRRTSSARVVHTTRRIEVRCPEHGHLLGVLNDANQLVIKCDHDEFVVVEVLPEK